MVRVDGPGGALSPKDNDAGDVERDGISAGRGFREPFEVNLAKFLQYRLGLTVQLPHPCRQGSARQTGRTLPKVRPSTALDGYLRTNFIFMTTIAGDTTISVIGEPGSHTHARLET